MDKSWVYEKNWFGENFYGEMKRGRNFLQLLLDSCIAQLLRLDHFDLDYTRHEDVRTVVETMMMAHRTHRN
ncbi:hypothetical protein CJ030_MR2G022350 [Morella rubra]|uniref:Uncharacterized protein n=1 Tax=Morella rubra TaxID=262757 RepID=A0A6A1WGR6_9ROSI|nr:hypothetical protein CJ030_MR2G022350 [Morella rubra]